MLPANSKNLKTEKAFTLIELLVVIAIVGILAGMVVVNMSGATESARIAKSKVFSNSVRSSLLADRVSEWNFDENSGTAAQDSWGSVNSNLVGGPTWKTGADCVSGSCLSFDESNDYVNVPVSSSLDFSGGFTISAWMNTLNTSRGTIFRNSWDASGYYELRPLNDKLEFGVASAGDFGTLSTAYSGTIQAGEWYHVVGVTDRTNVKIYVNGALKDTVLDKTSGTIGGGVGGIGGGAGAYLLNGKIDEVRIYNAALTASAVRGQYLAGLEEFLAKGMITNEDYQQRIRDLDQIYATE